MSGSSVSGSKAEHATRLAGRGGLEGSWRRCLRARALLALLLGGLSWPGSLPLAEAAPGRTRHVVDASSASVARALQALERAAATKGGQVGFSVRDLETGEVLHARNAELPLNPASNMKLLTTALALTELGPSYRFESGVWGALDAEGTCARLVLHGDGDPSLETEDLEALADGLHELGLRRVGELGVDQTAIGQSFVPPAFEAQPQEWSTFRAPVSAVALDRNTFTLKVRASGRPGDAALLELRPRGAVELEGGVRVGRPGSKESVSVELRASHAGSGSELEGRPRARLGGTLPPGSSLELGRRLEDPRRVPAQVLGALLRARGIETPDAVHLVEPPQGAALLTLRSLPLEALLPRLGKRSDNFYAEMLFKAVGDRAWRGASEARTGGSPEGWGLAAQRARTLLERWEAWSPGEEIHNGSGLYAGSRLSASSLTRLLGRTWKEPALREPFLGSLAIGGVDGTLGGRFSRWAGSQAIRAKTGTLDRALALSGYILRAGKEKAKEKPGAPVAFSLLVSAPRGKAAELRPQLDAVVDALASESLGASGI